MSGREFAFGQYLASLGSNLPDSQVEAAQADFNAGWDMALKEATS